MTANNNLKRIKFLWLFVFILSAMTKFLAAQPISDLDKYSKKKIINSSSKMPLPNLNFGNSLDMLEQISADSLALYVRQLSGDTVVFINAIPETIRTRFDKSDDIAKAQVFLQQKLENFGYQVELQEFSLTPIFGDIIFAPNNPLQGWFYFDGSIYHTSDGGENWEEQFSFITDRGVKNFEAVNDSLVWAVGYSGLLLKTSDGGVHWEFFEAPFDKHIYGVAFPDEKHGWIAGAYANIFRTSDGGITWEKQDLPTSFSIYAIDFVDSLNGWAVGPKGLILHTNDGGLNWFEQNSGSGEALLSVRFFSKDRGYAVGTNGTLLYTIDGGENWQIQILAPEEILWDVDFLDEINGVIVGSGGKIFITNNSGMSWIELNFLQDESCYYVHFNADTTIWVTGKGIFLSIKSWGENWKNYSDQFTKYRLNNIIATKSGTISPDTSVIICAHYDCMAEAENRLFLAPGADDNASGAATVLEAARVLKNEDSRYTIRFVLFSGEELGLLGSHYYANIAAENQENILGVINLDMLGYDGNGDGIFEIHAAEVGNSVQLGQLIQQNVDQFTLPLQPELIVENATRRSDHASFWEYGYSAILIIEDFSDFNPYYHTIEDIFPNIRTEYFANLGKLAILSLAQLTGITQSTQIVQEPEDAEIKKYFLSHAFPNPFNSATQFQFYLPWTASVKIDIFSITGQKVDFFSPGQMQKGFHKFIWESKNNPGGVYFVRFSFGEEQFVRKVVLLR